ncbi:MAG TPA: cytochrome P450 [Acidimicrobiales bacterium]|nr:cytochrome P450 [Acidimicrobiales bacterium]
MGNWTTVEGVDLLDMDRFQRGEHHEMFRRLRMESPVVWHDSPVGSGFWNVVRHPDVVEVNRDIHRFSSEVGGVNIFDFGELEDRGVGFDPRGVMMLYMDPPKHTRYRLLVNKGFTPRMIGLLEQYLRHRSVLIVDNIIERGGCDFVEDLAAELPLQAIAEIMGVPQEDRRLLFSWSNKMIGIDDPEYGTDDGTVASAELYAYVNELAKTRRTDPRDDIVTKLINAEVEGDKLSELEFDMFMLLLTVAGNETTRNTTAWGMHALMENPDAYATMRDSLDDPQRFNTAIEEILRWASPVLYFRRTATEDTAIHGQPIAKGDKVVMWYVSANRDEDVFYDPYTFDIERDPNDHIAFGGGGVHFCLGANLARMELRVIFREILARLPDMRLAGQPEMLRSNFIGGMKHLPVTYSPGKRVNPAPLGATA